MERKNKNVHVFINKSKKYSRIHIDLVDFDDEYLIDDATRNRLHRMYQQYIVPESRKDLCVNGIPLYHDINSREVPGVRRIPNDKVQAVVKNMVDIVNEHLTNKGLHEFRIIQHN